MPPTTPRKRRSAPTATTLTVLTALAVLVSLLAAVPDRAQAAVDPDTYYVLRARHSGKVLDVSGAATTDGAALVQWSRNDRPNQQFRFLAAGDGHYRLQARHSGKVLDVHERSTADGARVVQWTDLGGTNQQFRLEDLGNGHHQLINRHSGKALEVWEWSTADGARISQYADIDGANQQWSLIPVGNDGDGTDGECGSAAHHAQAVRDGDVWTAPGYRGTDMLAAMRAAVASLTPGRTWQERVVVRGSGSMSADSRLSLPSHTALDVCGTIDVTGSGAGDRAPVYARGVTDIEVGHLTLTGTPVYGIFLRNVTDVVLGRIDMRLSGGLGIRIDNHGDRSAPSRNIRIDTVYVSGTGSHGVETYGVDGLEIGTVTARDTGHSGLLLNDTVNATVGRVDARGAGTGTGYAAFRMANRNGRIGDAYPANIRVGEVVARGGGRGIFCVSESGGAVIDRVEIADTGNNAILIENCYNVDIAAEGGTVAGGGEVRLAARSDFPNNRDITLRNLTIADSALRESPCGIDIAYRNLVLVNSSRRTCS